MFDALKKAGISTAYNYLEKDPEKLRAIVAGTDVHSTDMQSPESAEHLCSKCDAYAANWAPTADKLWQCSCRQKAHNDQ